ncbi:hypothetical protein GPECTOR_8g408 [Gonium pectorale]|uniref:Autophagy-related protein 9 n=1 Tax=Gonium pectorale TaxID=33097 RepID=A0A150GTA1_GONPE|nr:hypothetical protein GPECTOR_8g408 [Gonium pectorale]|eukprot:KXZ53043.1 hypothetical protein GPECTOR_8g408 [Gonium pectorale]
MRFNRELEPEQELSGFGGSNGAFLTSAQGPGAPGLVDHDAESASASLSAPLLDSPALVGGESYEFAAIANLDLFFTRVYRYWHERGLRSILLSGALNLLALGFTAAFSTFLLLFVDWRALHAECIAPRAGGGGGGGVDPAAGGGGDGGGASRGCDLAAVGLDRRPLLGRGLGSDLLALSYIAVCASYLAWTAAHYLTDVRDMREVAHFMANKLGIGESKVVWWLGTMTVVLATCRQLVSEEPVAYDPERALADVVSYTHHLPRHWRGRAHTAEVQSAFLSLFRLKVALFAEELAGLLTTPLLLAFALPACADCIVEFVSSFTVHLEGVGDVCSLAAFDGALQRHGNAKYGAPQHADKPPPPHHLAAPGYASTSGGAAGVGGGPSPSVASSQFSNLAAPYMQYYPVPLYYAHQHHQLAARHAQRLQQRHAYERLMYGSSVRGPLPAATAAAVSGAGLLPPMVPPSAYGRAVGLGASSLAPAGGSDWYGGGRGAQDSVGGPPYGMHGGSVPYPGAGGALVPPGYPQAVAPHWEPGPVAARPSLSGGAVGGAGGAEPPRQLPLGAEDAAAAAPDGAAGGIGAEAGGGLGGRASLYGGPSHGPTAEPWLVSGRGLGAPACEAPAGEAAAPGASAAGAAARGSGSFVVVAGEGGEGSAAGPAGSHPRAAAAGGGTGACTARGAGSGAMCGAESGSGSGSGVAGGVGGCGSDILDMRGLDLHLDPHPGPDHEPGLGASPAPSATAPSASNLSGDRPPHSQHHLGLGVGIDLGLDPYLDPHASPGLDHVDSDLDDPLGLGGFVELPPHPHPTPTCRPAPHFRDAEGLETVPLEEDADGFGFGLVPAAAPQPAAGRGVAAGVGAWVGSLAAAGARGRGSAAARHPRLGAAMDASQLAAAPAPSPAAEAAQPPLVPQPQPQPQQAWRQRPQEASQPACSPGGEGASDPSASQMYYSTDYYPAMDSSYYGLDEYGAHENAYGVYDYGGCGFPVEAGPPPSYLQPPHSGRGNGNGNGAAPLPSQPQPHHLGLAGRHPTRSRLHAPATPFLPGPPELGAGDPHPATSLRASVFGATGPHASHANGGALSVAGPSSSAAAADVAAAAASAAVTVTPALSLPTNETSELQVRMAAGHSLLHSLYEARDDTVQHRLRQQRHARAVGAVTAVAAIGAAAGAGAEGGGGGAAWGGGSEWGGGGGGGFGWAPPGAGPGV